jgi:hypothetical protein
MVVSFHPQDTIGISSPSYFPVHYFIFSFSLGLQGNTYTHSKVSGDTLSFQEKKEKYTAAQLLKETNSVGPQVMPVFPLL